jgi:hypothetical protein
MNIKWRLNNLLVSALLLVIAINSRAAQKGYSLHEATRFQQVSSSSVVTGYSPLNDDQYGINAKVDTGGASLSAAPILGLPSTTSAYPSGSVTFPTGTNFSPTLPTGSGNNQYSVDVYGGNNLASVSAASGSGTFRFTLGNATARPTLSLNTASPAFPSTPMLTSGGTWSGSTLLLDPTATNVLTFNTGSFTTYTTGLGGEVSYQLLNPAGTAIIPKAQSVYVPSVGLTQPALTSFTLAPGTLVNGSSYIVKADYSQIENLNTTTFTGTGIPANFIGESHYAAHTYITVLAQTPTLTSTLAGNQVIISWPPTSTGWTLQTNNNLATGTWGNYLGPVGNNSITNSVPAGNLFFRLTHL